MFILKDMEEAVSNWKSVIWCISQLAGGKSEPSEQQAVGTAMRHLQKHQTVKIRIGSRDLCSSLLFSKVGIYPFVKQEYMHNITAVVFKLFLFGSNRWTNQPINWLPALSKVKLYINMGMLCVLHCLLHYFLIQCFEFLSSYRVSHCQSTALFSV